ncbi:hypothetical protein ACJ5W6_003901, partial [Enterobacter hormaechei]
NLAKGLSYKQKLNGSFFLIIDKSHPDGCEGGCFLCYCVRIVLSAIKMGLFFLSQDISWKQNVTGRGNRGVVV